MLSRSRFALAVVAMALVMSVMAGCVTPAATRPVLESNREILMTLQARHFAVVSLFDGATESLLAARRVQLQGEAHRSLVRTSYINGLRPNITADIENIQSDLEGGEVQNVILDEIRSGRMTANQAGVWLVDYARALNLSDDRGLARSMISGLKPIEDLDARAAALHDAIAAAAQEDAEAFEEAGLANELLISYSTWNGAEIARDWISDAVPDKLKPRVLSVYDLIVSPPPAP